MSRHFWRACHHKAGFSFVELLVTIIIAGIAFAAMVPLFVQAQKANASDNSRNLSLSVAQGRIERIRQLPYDQITTSELTSTLGSTASLSTGNGVDRVFQVSYAVQPVPATATDGTEQFKKVTVDVWWTGNPQPVKHVILSTFIYRQYSGPTISSFSVSPLTYVPPSGDTLEYWYLANPDVQLSAHIDPGMIDNTGSVVFEVLAHDGTEVFKETVDRTKTLILPDAYAGGTYSTEWNPTGYHDGLYTFRATAYSLGVATSGPAWEVEYDLETGAPAAPQGLDPISQGTSVKVVWTPAQASDIDHYELFRAELPQGEDPATFDWSSVEPPATAIDDNISPDIAMTGFIDRDVQLGHTYNYWLCAVDDDNYLGAFASAAVTVVASGDTQNPTAPTNLVATKVAASRTVNLTWTSSTDNVGVAGYRVYRANSAAASWPTGWTYIGDAATAVLPTYTDPTVDWGGTYSYRVLAFDAAGNWSDPSAASLAVTVDPEPPLPPMDLSITVDITNKYDASVEVINTDANHSYGSQSYRWNKTETKTWSSLPQGHYQLLVSQNGAVLTSKTRNVVLSAALGQPVTFTVP